MAMASLQERMRSLQEEVVRAAGAHLPTRPSMGGIPRAFPEQRVDDPCPRLFNINDPLLMQEPVNHRWPTGLAGSVEPRVAPTKRQQRRQACEPYGAASAKAVIERSRSLLRQTANVQLSHEMAPRPGARMGFDMGIMEAPPPRLHPQQQQLLLPPRTRQPQPRPLSAGLRIDPTPPTADMMIPPIPPLRPVSTHPPPSKSNDEESFSHLSNDEAASLLLTLSPRGLSPAPSMEGIPLSRGRSLSNDKLGLGSPCIMPSPVPMSRCPSLLGEAGGSGDSGLPGWSAAQRSAPGVTSLSSMPFSHNIGSAGPGDSGLPMKGLPMSRGVSGISGITINGICSLLDD